MKKFLSILAALLSLPVLVFGAQITVPSAPGTGYGLFSTSTGQYLATTTVYVSPGSKVGIGTTNPTDVNANAHLTVAGISSQDIIASTTDNTTLSDAILQAYAPGSRVFLGAHGTNQVSSRYGLTLGGWGEITAMNSTSGTLNGLILGTNTAVPLVFGTNNVEDARFDATGKFGIGSTTPTARLAVNGLAGGTDDLFNIASSTSGFATSSVLRIDKNGASTWGGNFTMSAGTLANFPSGTGTFAIGQDHVNLTSILVDGSSVGSYINMRANGTSYAWIGNANAFSGVGSNNLEIAALSGNGIYFNVNNSLNPASSAMTILSTGLVGVGSTTPWGQLSASSTSAAPTLAVEQKGTGAAAVFQGGNVGIGLIPASTNRLDIQDTTLAGSGSLAGSAVNVNQTWNTTGAPTAFKINVTNTASNVGLTSSKLFDFQVGGTSKFFFDVNAGAFYYATGLIRNTNNSDLFNDNNAGLLSIYSTDTAGLGKFGIAIASGVRATVKIADNISWTMNGVSTAVYSGLQVSPTANVGASNSGGTFYGARINPTFTAITGLTGAYIFGASAGGVDKFQITNTGLANFLIDGNSVQIGSGSNTAVYAGFAAQRGFFGYDGTSMLSQGGTGKALQFSVNSNTFGSGTVKLSVLSGATKVAIGGTITDSALGTGAAMVVADGSLVGIGTTTPVANLQVTDPNANSTTTVEFGKSGQTKGSCLKFYDEVGTAYYGKISGGALVISTATCKSGF